MISGFNTDIEFGGVTYHVQTEDKGLSQPMILSLVYDRGTILASKRLAYDDLLLNEFDENLLAERLQKQHHLICAAIQAGRMEELKRMTAGSQISAKTKSNKKRGVSKENVDVPIPPPEAGNPIEMLFDSYEPPIPVPIVDFANGPVSLFEKSDEKLPQGSGIFEEEFILPEEAVEILSDLDNPIRPANDKLRIEILGETNFKGGEKRTVGFMVCRGSRQEVVINAQIRVKVIGSSFRPLIFHASTDSNGLASVDFQLPVFRDGRAAFLVRAMSDGEEVELRRSIVHG